MSNVTAIQKQHDNNGLFQPTSLAETMEFAKLMAQSDIVPKDYQGKPGNVLVACQWGAEIGLPPLQAMQNIAVINGRPSLWGDALLALVRAHPEFRGIAEEVKGDGEDMIAYCTIERRGEAPVTRTFSMAEAKTAGLTSKQGPWKQYPKRMLQLRARSFCLRDTFTDALKGFTSREEAEDMREINPGPKTPSSAQDALRAALGVEQGEASSEPETALTAALEGIQAEIVATTSVRALGTLWKKHADSLTADQANMVKEWCAIRKAELQAAKASLDEPAKPPLPEHLAEYAADLQFAKNEYGLDTAREQIALLSLSDEDKALLEEALQ